MYLCLRIKILGLYQIQRLNYLTSSWQLVYHPGYKKYNRFGQLILKNKRKLKHSRDIVVSTPPLDLWCCHPPQPLNDAEM